MPPSIENSEYSDMFIEFNALKENTVKPIAFAAEITPIISVNGVNSNLNLFMIIRHIMAATAPINDASMLIFSELPRIFRYTSLSAKHPPNIATEININP